jgi:2-methylcitrate dehydratase PrpD
MRDPRVLEVRRRVELYGDDALQRAMPSRQGIVELTLRDGRTLRHPHEGRPRNVREPMTREEVDEKCFPLLAPVLGRQRRAPPDRHHMGASSA